MEPEITIRIYEASDAGYMYDIYANAPDDLTDVEPDDGGQCTSTFNNAVDMAAQQAKDLFIFKIKYQ